MASIGRQFYRQQLMRMRVILQFERGPVFCDHLGVWPTQLGVIRTPQVRVQACVVSIEEDGDGA